MPRGTPVSRSPQSTESREVVYGAGISIAKTLMRVLGLRVVVVGHENIPADSAAVLAINHTSFLDFIFAGVPAYLQHRRVVRFLYKKEISESHSSVGWIMRAMKHIPVDRSAGADALAEAERHCRDGHLVGIFPEGTISRSFNLKEFKTGAARIAQSTGVPLIPVILWGCQRLWTKDLPRTLGRKKLPIVIMVGAPVDTSGTPDETTARLRDAMTSLLDKARAAYAENFGPIPEGAAWIPAHLGGSAPTQERADLLDKAELERRAARRREKDKKAE